jgi:transmembrane sensor
MNALTKDWLKPEAVWFARRRDPEAARRTADSFETWRAADASHAARYDQCELVWERVGDLAEDNDVQQWLAALDAKVQRKPRKVEYVKWAAAAMLMLAVGLVSWSYVFSPEIYQTAIGEQRDVRLPDGSNVTLNTATKLVVRYGDTLRRIELQSGEAAFEVRKDANRPFEVLAGKGIVRAIGTKFVVQRASGHIKVSVLEGTVHVMPGADESAKRKESVEIGGKTWAPFEPSILNRGQAATIATDGKVLARMPANTRRIESWQSRRLDFESEPLAEAIAEVNRYTTRSLVLGRPELARIRISGVFEISELEGFAFALQQSFGLRVMDDGDERVVLPADANHGSR